MLAGGRAAEEREKLEVRTTTFSAETELKPRSQNRQN